MMDAVAVAVPVAVADAVEMWKLNEATSVADRECAYIGPVVAAGR